MKLLERENPLPDQNNGSRLRCLRQLYLPLGFYSHCV